MPIIPIIRSYSKGESSNPLPIPTQADNGKVVGVNNGEYSIMDVPYTQTITFFSGNATVVDLG